MFIYRTKEKRNKYTKLNFITFFWVFKVFSGWSLHFWLFYFIFWVLNFYFWIFPLFWWYKYSTFKMKHTNDLFIITLPKTLCPPTESHTLPRAAVFGQIKEKTSYYKEIFKKISHKEQWAYATLIFFYQFCNFSIKL